MTNDEAERGKSPSLSTMLRHSLDGNVIQVDFRKGKRKMAKKKKTTDDDDIDELLDDLDEVEEEDEDEDVEEDDDDESEEDEDEEEDDEEEDDDDDEDEDPDEAPAPRRKSRGSKSKSSKKSAAKKERSGVGTVEIADAAGTTPRQLRAYLRNNGIQAKDDREGRYRWSSLSHPEVKKIIKAVKGGAIARENKARLAKLKDKKAAKSTAKKSSSKKATAKKKRSTKA